MNKARVAEAARGFIPKLDAEVLFGVWKLIVDFCVSAEHRTGNGIHPQMMPDVSAKTGSLDETKECVSV